MLKTGTARRTDTVTMTGKRDYGERLAASFPWPGADPTGDELIRVDPSTAEFAANPYPLYARLRERGPATCVALPNGSYAWMVTGFDQVRAVLTDPRFSNVPPIRPMKYQESPARRRLAGHMLNTDPPDHTRLRRLVAATFTPTRVAELAPRIASITSGLLSAMAIRTTRLADAPVVDLVKEFALSLPILVIGEVLGLPEQDASRLGVWTTAVTSPVASSTPGAVERAWTHLYTHMRQLIETKRRAPGADLFSRLIHVRDDGDRHSPMAVGLSDDELVSMAFLLLTAGYETTMNLLASATVLLLSHPRELAAVRADSERWTAVVEEVLRHASPLEAATWRTTTQEVELSSSVRIPEGASVLAVLAAANRDPRVYPDPDAFTPTRYLPHHTARGREASRAPASLAFGYGPHFCLGAALARLEATVALPMLFDAFPRLRLAVDAAALPYRPGLLMRGPQTVPVHLA